MSVWYNEKVFPKCSRHFRKCVAKAIAKIFAMSVCYSALLCRCGEIRSKSPCRLQLVTPGYKWGVTAKSLSDKDLEDR